MRTGTMLAVLCAGAGVACDESTDTEALEVTHDAHFAVVSDNYGGAVVVSLLGADGEVVEHAWLSPRIDNPDLRTPFTDDVVLTGTSTSRRYLTVIERSLGVVTRFDLEDGSVVGQLKTDDSPEDDMAAFHSNPNDALDIADDLAWASRWAKNLDPAAPEAEQGNDLVGFDPGTMMRNGMRVDLDTFDTMVTETQYDDMFNPIGDVESTAWARPSRLVLAGDHLVVGLVRMTDAYSPAEGATAVVDPTTGEITDEVTHTGLKNCGDVYPVAGDDTRVLVGCIGDYNTGLGPETGIVMLAIDADGTASVAESYLVSEHDGAAAAAQYLASLGGALVLAVASGTTDFDTGDVLDPDRAYLVDLATGTQQMLFESAGAFSIGLPAFDPDTGVLLVPDAGSFDDPQVGVRRFHVDGSDVTEGGFVEVAPDDGLAARQALTL